MGDSAAPIDRPPRQRSLDALRGVAAVVVMLYHYTRRYGEHFDPDWRPAFSYDGRFGVLLFFMLSGYVITLTTRRVNRPGDFLFARFSRLFPTFWVCLAITTAVTAFTYFPGRPPGPPGLVANATMLAKSLGRLTHHVGQFRYVDGSYWSLEIELFFYAVVFALLLARQSTRIVAVAIGFTALSVLNAALMNAGRSGLPSVVQWGFFLEYWPYFGIGIALYGWQRAGERVGPVVLAVVAAIGVGLTGWQSSLRVAACAALFVLAAYDRLPPLRWRPLVWLGVISYPLYLLHQSIGYVVIHAAVGRGVGTNVAIGLAIVVSVALAAAVNVGVERPTMHLLRRLYRRETHHLPPADSVSGLAPAIPMTAEDRAG